MLVQVLLVVHLLMLQLKYLGLISRLVKLVYLHRMLKIADVRPLFAVVMMMTNYNAILSGLTLKTGKMDANIQLGAAPQGAMVKLNTKMVGGLEIKNLGILDNSTKGKAVLVDEVLVGPTAVTAKEAGEIFIESIKIADA